MGDCSCSKITVVAINLLFMIFGLAILIVGIVFKVQWDDIRDAFIEQSDKVDDFNLKYAGNTLGLAAIIFGAVMLGVALIGFIGGCCRVKFLLAVYAIILMIILIGQIVCVALVAVNADTAEDKLKEGLREGLKGFDETLKDDRSKSWSMIFQTFECCGVDGNTTADFTNNGFKKSGDRGNLNAPFPLECCKNVDYENYKKSQFTEKDVQSCLSATTLANNKYAYTTGCETKIMDWFKDNKGIAIGVGVAVFIIELLCILMAFYMCCCQNDKDGYYA